MPRFGKDKNARNEDLDRQAAEEVERLTRRGMGGGAPGMPGTGGGPPRIGPPSPLEMMAAEVADRPSPGRRGAEPARRPAPRPQQAFTPMPSGQVGSSFGPGGLNPGPRGGVSAPPPPAFGGGAYDEDYGGHVTGPPVYNAEPDEDEEMSITEMALMDHAARTGHNPEDLVMMYDAGTAEEMRDQAMRRFYERQAGRGPGGGTNDPFAPAGKRRGPAGPATAPRREDPAAAGGALAQRLAARRRREEEQARQGGAAAAPEAAPAARSTRPTAPSAASGAARPAPADRDVDEGALARVLARRRAALGVDAPAAPAEPEPADQPEPPGRRHAAARGPLRAVPEAEDVPTLDDAAQAPPARARKAPAKKAAKAPAKRAPKKAAAADAAPLAMPPATEKPAAKAPAKRAPKKAAAGAKAPAKKAPAAKKAAAAKKGGATLATPAPARKAAAKKTTKAAGKAKTIFCIECGEKNPVIAKFCFNCGTRLAAPEG